MLGSAIAPLTLEEAKESRVTEARERIARGVRVFRPDIVSDLCDEIERAHKAQGDAVIDAHLLRVEVESLHKQIARQSPFEWDDSKPNFWRGAWKYHTTDQCLEFCAARPEHALAYINELRAELTAVAAIPSETKFDAQDDIGLWFDEEEKAAIADLSARLELRPAKVIKQALRVFQLQTLGEPNLSKGVPSTPSSSAEIARKIAEKITGLAVQHNNNVIGGNLTYGIEKLEPEFAAIIESGLAATPQVINSPKDRANSFKALLAEQMKDQEFAEAYEEISTKENELLAQIFPIDEVTRRMDAVVDAAVAWRQSDDVWNDDLERAVDSLLELRSPPESEKQ